MEIGVQKKITIRYGRLWLKHRREWVENGVKKN